MPKFENEIDEVGLSETMPESLSRVLNWGTGTTGAFEKEPTTDLR